MITEVNVKLVFIQPDEISEKAQEGSTIIVPETAKEKLQRAQNKGIVKLVGKDCTWAKVGDYVSFYRAAGTDIVDDGKNFVLVHEDHCLAKIKTNEKK